MLSVFTQQSLRDQQSAYGLTVTIYFVKPFYKSVWLYAIVIQLLSLEYQNLANSLPWRNASLYFINLGLYLISLYH